MGNGTGRVRHVSTRGLEYERRGAGRPLIFLHGWCLNRRMWLYAEEAFAASHDVITPDLAGFGGSAGLAGPYSFARHADDLLALIAELDLDRPVLAGFAYGAAVAMEAAARPGAGIAGVVAVGAPSAAASPYARMPRAMRRDWPDFARRSAEALFHARPSQATLDWIAAMFAAAPLPVAIEAVGDLARFVPEEAAPRVPAPQLFVQGAQDAVSPLATGQACAAAAPDGRLAVIEDCGHLIVIEAKEAFHARLAAFLATLTDRQAPRKQDA